MKWPKSLVFVRHAESAYNLVKKRRAKSEPYRAFQDYFEKSFQELTIGGVVNGTWPDARLKELAARLCEAPDLFVDVSDYETPLSELGHSQAQQTGERIRQFYSQRKLELPDVIYVSPYLRTRQTLSTILEHSPELRAHVSERQIRIVEEERIREQEHGAVAALGDWRLYMLLHPAAALHYLKQGHYADYLYRFPHGENQADVRDRLRAFISTLIREHAGENMLVISHHLALLSLRANLERWSIDTFIQTDKDQKPHNCGLTIFRGRAEAGGDGKLVLADEDYNIKIYDG